MQEIPEGKIELDGGVWMEDPALKTVPPPPMFHMDCPNCGTDLAFERDPADWPNHPDGMQVVVECPRCNAKLTTQGESAAEFVKRVYADVEAEVRAEVARRAGVRLVEVYAADSAEAGDVGTRG